VGGLGTLGLAVSVGTAIGLVVVALIAARSRRTARKNSELEELREMNLAAMGYIYRVEMAYQQACNRLGVGVDWEALKKPRILNRQYLAEKAINEGNREIADLVSAVTHMQEQMKLVLPPPGPPGPPPKE
jgi:hypothetical protein